MTQHPPVHHPENPVLEFHGWDETLPKGAVYMVSSFYFLLGLIFPRNFFFPAHCFFSRASLLIFIYFLATPAPILFFGNSYPPLKSTYCPSSCCHASHLLIDVTLSASFYLIPSFSAHLHPQCLRNRDSLSIWV